MKHIINTPNAPQPIGPYNQAVIVNDILYCSGQIAIDPTTNALVLSSMEEETKQVMENIKGILSYANIDFNAVFKSTIFIKNMDNFNIVNTVYGSYFNHETAPARETVEVSRLPKDVNVEISVMALVR